MSKLLSLYFQLPYLIQKLWGRRLLHSRRLHCSDWTGMSSTDGDGCSDERRTTTCHSLHLSVESKGTVRLIFLELFVNCIIVSIDTDPAWMSAEICVLRLSSITTFCFVFIYSGKFVMRMLVNVYER